MTRIAIVGAGAMGSAIAQRVTAAGHEVVTVLDGRSDATRERARRAGMIEVSRDALVDVPLLLSIVPPGQAEAVVDHLAPAFERAAAPPVFVDCNALSPDTKRRLASRIEGLGGRLIDATIIGLPPVAGRAGPPVYVSGEGAGAAMAVLDGCLDLRVIDGPVGAAAALKMCFAGINKGLTALTAAMLLAAERSGAGPPLRAAIDERLPWLSERSRVAVPAMYPKAYRWVDEMHEIAHFLDDDPAAAAIYEAAARFFADRADAHRTGEELARLQRSLDARGDDDD